MGAYQSQLYLLKDIKEHDCEQCKKRNKMCYASKINTNWFVSTLDEVYSEYHDDYEQYHYTIKECQHFLRKTNERCFEPCSGKTKITVDVGYHSRLSKEILGKLLYSSSVNMHSIDISKVERGLLPCHQELGQACSENLELMYRNRRLFGSLFKNVTPESLKKCHLFVRNTGTMIWDIDYHIGRLKWKSNENQESEDDTYNESESDTEAEKLRNETKDNEEKNVPHVSSLKSDEPSPKDRLN